MKRMGFIAVTGLMVFAWPVECAVSVASDGAVAGNERIEKHAFDEYGRRPISFYYCQAGFHPAGYKPIYIWTRKEYSSGTASLHDSITGKITSVPLVSRGVTLWGRQDWIADCSSVTTEGR